MKILYFSQYFPPEAGATQTRAYEMARNWVKRGHHVTMIAEFPNHPSGIMPPAYRSMLYERADLEGIDVLRVWVKASPKKNFRNRMLFYLTYMFNAILAGLLLARGKYDLIHASSPPLFVGGAALVVSILRRIPMFFEVRDLWPESAVALGELNNPGAIRWATRLEEACYRRAKKVIVVTRGIFNRLVERGIPAEKIAIIPNGANVDLFQYNPGLRAEIRKTFNLEQKFILVYAGIHGVAQGLEIVIEAARSLVHDPDIHFIMIGEGPEKTRLAELVQQYRLTNITMLTEQPRESIPGYLSASDVSLIPLRNVEIFKGALPSKIFDAWACERPVILSVDGEARQILEQAGGGVFVPPEDTTALVKAILDLKNQPGLRQSMGSKGRTYTMENYSRQALAANLLQLITSVIMPEKS